MSLLFALLLGLFTACSNSEPTDYGQTATPPAQDSTALEDSTLYISRSTDKQVEQMDKLDQVSELIIDTEMNCSQLAALCAQENASQLTYLLLSQLTCDSWPSGCTGFSSLEKLIIKSNSLQDIPSAIFSLPQLKNLEFESSNLTTIEAEIPKNTAIEEIHLGYSPLQSLGTLKNMTTLKVLSLAADERLAADLAVVRRNNPGIEIVEN